jgi:23S rRNA (uracil1939-C5)-methyltransferase
LRGAVRLTVDGASFVLEGATRWPNASAFADRVPVLTTIWWEPAAAKRRLLVDRRGADGSGNSRSHDAHRPDASFVQVNTAAAELLHDRVVSVVTAHEPRVIVDAYAGSGSTAIALAKRGARVTAIELDPVAARWVAAHLPDGSRSIVGRVEEELPRTLPADIVVLNPPRAGVDERVTALLRSAIPATPIVYVSCNPATLARDVMRLPAHRVASIASFDMFPQTAHVETVCELIPEVA